MEQFKAYNQQYNTLLMNEQYDEALLLLNRFFDENTDDHWAIAQRAIIYYEKLQYQEALVEIKKAYAITQKCSLVNSYMADILRVNDHIYEAIRIYEEIISTDINLLAFEECGEGLKWTISLRNDIYYMLSKSYYEIKKWIRLSNILIFIYIIGKRGQFSVRSKQEAVNLKNKIIQNM